MVQKNLFSQNPIESETRMTMQENPILTSTQNAIKLKSQISPSTITQNPVMSKMRNPIARFGRDIANTIVDDSANSVSLCGVNMTTAGVENTMMASVYTTMSVYSGSENMMGSVYGVQNTMGSVFTTTSVYGHNIHTIVFYPLQVPNFILYRKYGRITVIPPVPYRLTIQLCLIRYG